MLTTCAGLGFGGGGCRGVDGFGDDGGGGDVRELHQVLHRPVLHQHLLDDSARRSRAFPL